MCELHKFYTRAKRGEAKPGNNISERRMSKANEPVSEHSERASGYALGCMTGEWSEVSRVSGVFYILLLIKPIKRKFRVAVLDNR